MHYLINDDVVCDDYVVYYDSNNYMLLNARYLDGQKAPTIWGVDDIKVIKGVQ